MNDIAYRTKLFEKYKNAVYRLDHVVRSKIKNLDLIHKYAEEYVLISKEFNDYLEISLHEPDEHIFDFINLRDECLPLMHRVLAIDALYNAIGKPLIK